MEFIILNFESSYQWYLNKTNFFPVLIFNDLILIKTNLKSLVKNKFQFVAHISVVMFSLSKC